MVNLIHCIQKILSNVTHTHTHTHTHILAFLLKIKTQYYGPTCGAHSEGVGGRET